MPALSKASLIPFSFHGLELVLVCPSDINITSELTDT